MQVTKAVKQAAALWEQAQYLWREQRQDDAKEIFENIAETSGKLGAAHPIFAAVYIPCLNLRFIVF